jgi:hypothetical protein
MPARNLTPAFAATDCEEEARKWWLTDLAHQCIFCGSGRVEVTLAAPEEKTPVILNIGVCRDCLIDTILTRWAAVKHQRIARVGQDMAAAVNEISAACRRASHERCERRFNRCRAGVEPEYDPNVEAAAARELADEEERIARERDMCSGWSYDEFKKDMARRWAERRRKTPT